MAAEANILATAKLRAKTPVGSQLNSAEWADVPLALRERAFFSAEVEKMRLLQRMQDRVQTALDVLRRPGMGRGGGASERGGEAGRADGGDGAFQTREKFVAEMRQLAQKEGLDPRNTPGTESRLGTIRDITSERRLKLIYNQQTESALEYARWKAEQDPDVLAAYPAQEFVRIKRVKKPRIDWPERWRKAGGTVRPDGRMIALKNDKVWRKLSRFGTPYPPFDFGSGMGLRDIGRRDAEKLGLIKRGDPPPIGAEDGFNDDLKASIADLNPEYRALLEETFEGRVKIDGDMAQWVPSKVAQAQQIDRRETPAPEVTPGAGLIAEPERATAEEAASLALPAERATIYDDQGAVLATLEADPASPGKVTLPPELWPQLRDRTFSHNHVSAGAPSMEDLLVGHAHNLAEMRVIATDLDNRPFLYRLRRPPAGWPGDWAEAERRFRATAAEVLAELQAEVAAGRMSQIQSNAEWEHRTLERLVARHPDAAIYERIAL